MNTLKMDHFVASSISEILDNGVNSLGARPKYASDGKTANSKYITDVFIKFYLDKGEVPISRLRPVYTGLARQELFWIYQDQTSDLQPLRDRGVHWWEDWALEDRTIGQRYGATVNRYNLIDRLIEGLEKNPYNRRNIINLWQYKDLDETEGLMPCAFQTIWDVREVNGETFLDMSLIQRSSDFLVAGMGINQIQYVALQMMVAKHFGWKVGTFSWHVMNLHIYDRYFAQAQELVARFEKMNQEEQKEIEFYLDVPDKTNFYDIKPSDFVLKGYSSVGDQMKFDMAI